MDMCENANKKLVLEMLADQPADVLGYLSIIVSAMDYACEKHPAWPEDYIHQSAIVAEEAGEMVQKALQLTYERGRLFDIHNEAIQTAAVGLRFLVEDYRRNKQDRSRS